MTTATIGIGNSDDKLSQIAWSNYIEAVAMMINISSYKVYFAGFSNPTKPWQNACWVIDIGDDVLYLKRQLIMIAKRFNQDSIALTVGETELLGAED